MAKRIIPAAGATRPARRGPKKPAPKKPTPANGQPERIVTELPPPSPLRGFLPTPPEVEEWVEQILKDRPAFPAARRRITDDVNMQYYFGGHPIAFRDTDQGKEVLAVGWQEIKRLKRKRLTDAERESIVIGWYDPW